MKKAFSIRKIDNLGRIVIPRDFRKALDISDWDELFLSLEGATVVIKKATDQCTFCGSEENLISYHDKFICQECLSKLSSK